MYKSFNNGWCWHVDKLNVCCVLQNCCGMPPIPRMLSLRETTTERKREREKKRSGWFEKHDEDICIKLPVELLCQEKIENITLVTKYYLQQLALFLKKEVFTKDNCLTRGFQSNEKAHSIQAWTEFLFLWGNHDTAFFFFFFSFFFNFYKGSTQYWTSGDEFDCQLLIWKT